MSGKKPDSEPPASPHPADFPLRVHPGASPGALRAAVVAALRAGALPVWLLYRSDAQSRRWLAYHRAVSPFPNDGSLRRLYRRAATEVAAELPPDCRVLVGLGAGDGKKDAGLLRAMAARASELCYVPVDGSAGLARLAGREAAGLVRGLAVTPLLADLATAPDLTGWLAGALPGAPRLFSCHGLWPNQHYTAFPDWLAGLLRAPDVLMLSANLSPNGYAADRDPILAQYDNPPAREWYHGALDELGLSRESYALTIAAQSLHQEGVWRIEAHALFAQDVVAEFEGEGISFASGEALRVFHSNRFTAGAAEHLLEAAGLAVRSRWIHPGGEEGIFFCVPG